MNRAINLDGPAPALIEPEPVQPVNRTLRPEDVRIEFTLDARQFMDEIDRAAASLTVAQRDALMMDYVVRPTAARTIMGLPVVESPYVPDDKIVMQSGNELVAPVVYVNPRTLGAVTSVAVADDDAEMKRRETVKDLSDYLAKLDVRFDL